MDGVWIGAHQVHRRRLAGTNVDCLLGGAERPVGRQQRGALRAGWQVLEGKCAIVGGEGLLAAGDTVGAIAAYRKSVENDEQMMDAIDRLKRLGAWPAR